MESANIKYTKTHVYIANNLIVNMQSQKSRAMYVVETVFASTKELSIRVFGVDTPEKGHRAMCPSEDQRGQAATAFTKNAISKAQKRQVAIADWDKYGGRVLGDILLDGQSLRMMLIQNGFAREYYGEAKTAWCN